MSLIDRINEITEHCEWAKNTIEDKVTFNLPKEQAEISRERRAHGALVDACKLIKELKQSNTEFQTKLDKVVEALEYFDEVLRIRKSFKIEELEYKAITTLTEIGEHNDEYDN